MDQAGIFNQETDQSQNTQAANAVSADQAVVPAPLNDLLGEIRNERGEPKYKSPEEALKALQHAQQFIPQLTEDNKALRAEVERLTAVAEKISHLEQVIERLTANQPSGEKTTTPVIDEQAIASVMERTLAQRESQQRRASNTKTVVEKLRSEFGDKAGEVFYSKASELGLTREYVENLAAEAPQAVFKLFGISEGNGKPKTHSPVLNSLNTSGFSPQGETYIKRNDQSLALGATTQDYMAAKDKAAKMVEELHTQGMSVYDLTDPKKYFQLFK